MRVDVITLFPEIFAALNSSIPGRAQRQQLISLHYWNPRDFALDKQRTVDDSPYGGGPGMVMKVSPLIAAIAAAKAATPLPAKTSYMSPQGRVLCHSAVQSLAKRQRLILVAGRYEGIDERLLQTTIDEEWSVGDFVTSGGELPALCLLDAVIRLLPGALGDTDSATQDSFVNGLLDYPHYTRPEQILGYSVPAVLLSGNHQVVKRWRLKQALGNTWLKRPDLLEKHMLNAEEHVLLAEFIDEYPNG